MDPNTPQQVVVLGDVKAILDAGRALGAPISVGESDNPLKVVVLPQGYKTEALETHIAKFRANPLRTKVTVALATAASFIAYVADFKLPFTRIFAVVPENNTPPSFLAIIDYHDPEGDSNWCEHRAAYACQFTPEWTRWMAKNNVHMTQQQLAEFLEENQSIIVAPPGAELLELVQNLEGKNNISCNSMVRLPNGKQKLVYEEDVTLKGTINKENGEIEFPSALTVAIAPFADGPAYRINCRLRYRIPNRRLEFWFEAVDVHLVVRECVNDLVKKINEELEVEVLFGSPTV